MLDAGDGDRSDSNFWTQEGVCRLAVSGAGDFIRSATTDRAQGAFFGFVASTEFNAGGALSSFAIGRIQGAFGTDSSSVGTGDTFCVFRASRAQVAIFGFETSAAFDAGDVLRSFATGRIQKAKFGADSSSVGTGDTDGSFAAGRIQGAFGTDSSSVGTGDSVCSFVTGRSQGAFGADSSSVGTGDAVCFVADGEAQGALLGLVASTVFGVGDAACSFVICASAVSTAASLFATTQCCIAADKDAT